MKKIILLLLLQVTVLMAITYNVTNDGQMIPVTEDQSPTTEVTATPTTPTTGSAETNWGFQPFTVPTGVVNVPAGGNIQAAIDSLPNGGTINLEAGTYYVNRLEFNQNMVFQGAGIGKTILMHEQGVDYIIYNSGTPHSNNFKNFIMRNMTVDGSNGNKNITLAYGVGNLLFENLEVRNASGIGITINNVTESYRNSNVTIRNIESHHHGQHAFDVRFVTGLIIEDCYFHDLVGGDGGYAFDLSGVRYAEIASVLVEDSTDGSKFPNCDYMYMHDTTFRNLSHAALKLQQGEITGGVGYQHLHLKNITLDNTYRGIYCTDSATSPYLLDEVVVEDMTISGTTYYDTDKVRLYDTNYVYEYVTGVDKTYAAVSGAIDHLMRTGNTPEIDGVGYKSWPTFPQ